MQTINLADARNDLDRLLGEVTKAPITLVRKDASPRVLLTLAQHNGPLETPDTGFADQRCAAGTVAGAVRCPLA